MEDVKKFGIVINILSFVVVFPLMIYVFSHCEGQYLQICFGAIAASLALLPHELLHALCFQETVYLYHYLSKGLLFVVGSECMSKKRFIFMSLLPNIVFGLIPFVLYCFHPQWVFLGSFGAISLSSGVGDYYNVYHALTQMPKGAYTYLYQFHSYWYMPEEKLPSR